MFVHIPQKLIIVMMHTRLNSQNICTFMRQLNLCRFIQISQELVKTNFLIVLIKFFKNLKLLVCIHTSLIPHDMLIGQ